MSHNLNLKSEAIKCSVCSKQTSVGCSRCGIPICSEHGFKIARGYHCKSCGEKLLKRGIIIRWGLVGLMVTAAVVVLLLT